MPAPSSALSSAPIRWIADAPGSKAVWTARLFVQWLRRGGEIGMPAIRSIQRNASLKRSSCGRGERETGPQEGQTPREAKKDSMDKLEHLAMHPLSQASRHRLAKLGPSIRTFFRLPPSDRHLLVRTVLLLSGIRLALSILSLRTLRHLLTRLAPEAAELDNAIRVPLDRIAWAIGVGSRYVPGATCLAQALTGQVLLARYGHPADLHIGFARGEDGRLQAHAWLESRGQVVVGGTQDLSRFARLPSLG